MDENKSSDEDREPGNLQCQNDPHYPPGYSNMADFTMKGFKILMDSIRHSNALPTQRDYDFYNAQESFKKVMTNEGNHILSLMNCILRNNGIKDNIKSSILDHKTELLIEVNDTILEKVANSIDEMSGIKISNINPIELQTVSGVLPINGSWNRVKNTKFSLELSGNTENQPNLGSSSIRLLTAKNIVRPQKCFVDKIDNSNLYPWEPKIKDKANSLKPLAIFLEETNRGEEFSHPYEFELDNFRPPDEQLSVDEEPLLFPKMLAETALIEVDEPEQLDDLVEDLRNHKIIAIDLEHHSYRTFMGITCLMQISTGSTDYIIDTLALRDKLHVLNEIFTKPSILKVFHGADSDILWLQRDLSLYIVNMFDTHQAAKLLEFSSLSLASLLEKFCNFKPNKHFQLADWRIRPLPDVLKEYAREDTHYLIYIYQKLKAELLKKAGGVNTLLNTVYQNSTEICKKRYFKQRWTEESHVDFYRMCKRMFDNQQMYALKEIYKWRDQIAREEDESTSYILPNHMLLQIAETLPREMQGILACCNPIPPLVRANLLELHHIILKARDKPVEKLILQEDTRARGSTIKVQKLNIDNPLHCPHDLTKYADFRDDLPVLLIDQNKIQKELVNIISKPCQIEEINSVYSIFSTEKKKYSKISSQKQRFLSPFERYQFVKPFIQDEEKKKALEKEAENKKTEINSDIKPRLEDIQTEVPDVIEIEDDLEKVNKNLDNLIQENKTDDERISSIRNHFKLLSKKTQEDEELARKREEQLYQRAKVNEQSLIELGGTKKRKREKTDDNVPFDNTNMEYRFLNPAPYQTSEKYVPLGQKKRKNEVDCQEMQNKTSLNQIWRRKKLRNKTKAKNDRRDSKKKKIQKRVDPNTSKLKVKEEKHIRGIQNSIRENFNLPGQSTFSPEQSQKESSEKGAFEAFDYTSVDFRQFQGGAGSVNQGKNIKSKFKNKGKRKDMNKTFNKSVMFNNSGRKR